MQATPFFVLFDHWDPPGHPHGPQSLQKRSQEAPKPQFCIFFAPIFSHFGYNFHMFFIHFCRRLSTFFQMILQHRVYSSRKQANNLHSKRAFLSSGQQANNLTAKASFAYRDQSTKLQPRCNKAGHGGGTARRATG